jgi:hypothetical protein
MPSSHPCPKIGTVPSPARAARGPSPDRRGLAPPFPDTVTSRSVYCVHAGYMPVLVSPCSPHANLPRGTFALMTHALPMPVRGAYIPRVRAFPAGACGVATWHATANPTPLAGSLLCADWAPIAASEKTGPQEFHAATPRPGCNPAYLFIYLFLKKSSSSSSRVGRGFLAGVLHARALLGGFCLTKPERSRRVRASQGGGYQERGRIRLDAACCKNATLFSAAI